MQHSFRQAIKDQLPFCLQDSNLDFLGSKYSGKVRDNYTRGERRFLVTSDRLSCFDVVVTTIPYKGQVLNQMAAYWFERTRHLVENHLLAVPDPNVMVVRLCEVLPVEVVVRAYLAGSAWRDYAAGKEVSGMRLPTGLSENQRLPETIVTPSTKACQGHDQPISETELLQRGLVASPLWQEVKQVSIRLFNFASEQVAQRGLILADTKYEFGLYRGRLVLVDEIHTLDSSRFWVAASYPERFKARQAPEMLDKEPTRQWLLSQGFKGEGPVPQFSDTQRVAIAEHYITSYERICGLPFVGRGGDVHSLMERNLREYLEHA